MILLLERLQLPTHSLYSNNHSKTLYRRFTTRYRIIQAETFESIDPVPDPRKDSTPLAGYRARPLGILF